MRKRRRGPTTLVGHMLQNTGANLLMPLSSIITGPLLARALDPSGRGAMAALVVPISLANLLFTFGLPESLTFHVARRRLGRRQVVVVAIAGGLVAGTIAVLALWVLTPTLLAQYPEYHLLFRLLSLTLLVTITFAALRGAVLGWRRFELVAYERLTAVLVRTMLLVVLLLVGVLTPAVAAYTTVLAAVLASGFLLRGLVRHHVQLERRPDYLAVSRYAATAAVATFGGVVMLRVDQTVMTPLASPEQLGFYAVAVSLAELPFALALAVRDLVTTVAADSGDPEYAAMAARRVALVVLPMSLAGVATAPVLLPLLFGSAFEPAVAMTQILFLGTVASTTSTIMSGGLLSAGRPALASLVMIVGAAATVPALFVAVPHWGGIGAAIVTAGGYALVCLLSTLLYSRVTGVRLLRCLVPDATDVREVWTVAADVLARRRNRGERREG